MSLFEQLLKEYGVCAERFVKFKISIKADAEVVLQEVYTLAYQNFEQLKNKVSEMSAFSMINQKSVESITDAIAAYSENMQRVIDDSKHMSEVSKQMLATAIISK